MFVYNSNIYLGILSVPVWFRMYMKKFCLQMCSRELYFLGLILKHTLLVLKRILIYASRYSIQRGLLKEQKNHIWGKSHRCNIHQRGMVCIIYNGNWSPAPPPHLFHSHYNNNNNNNTKLLFELLTDKNQYNM